MASLKISHQKNYKHNLVQKLSEKNEFKSKFKSRQIFGQFLPVVFLYEVMSNKTVREFFGRLVRYTNMAEKTEFLREYVIKSFQ